MNYSLNVHDWFALAPGLSCAEDWQQWVEQTTYSWPSDLVVKPQKIPMMVARRMSMSSKVAVEVALVLAERNPAIDAAVFVSRHSETERTYHIVKNLAKQQDISPTSFAMSVHNTAAGLFTIEAKKNIAVSSLSAGVDGFQQAMLEVQTMLSTGKKQVLLVDFDSTIPAAYHPKVSHYHDGLVYAVALVVTAGHSLTCTKLGQVEALATEVLPQALTFLKNILSKKSSFTIKGLRADWQWQLKDV